MNLKKLLFFLIILMAGRLMAADPAPTTKLNFYGFVSNDFIYNSRQNIEAIDGIVHLFPKPVSENTYGNDVNAKPQAEMLSIMTRMGVDISGAPIFGAKSSGKIEADLAGFGTTNTVLRIRHAYVRLDWAKTELLVGQYWHPFFTTMIPGTMSMNAGAPFQPFNRSPMVYLQRNLGSGFSASVAAVYQLQFLSQGPLGASNVYMKNALTPELYAGIEHKSTHWTLGASVDYKRIKPDSAILGSVSATAYGQYSCGMLAVRARSVFGENLSDQLMIGGYGVSKYAKNGTTASAYTSYQTFTNWLSIIYGKKIQAELYLGTSANLGTTSKLAAAKDGTYTSYGYGFYTVNSKQLVLDRLYRVAPQITYNLPNFRIGLEYDCTIGSYGTVQEDGSAKDHESVTNHRLIGRVVYMF